MGGGGGAGEGKGSCPSFIGKGILSVMAKMGNSPKNKVSRRCKGVKKKIMIKKNIG